MEDSMEVPPKLNVLGPFTIQVEALFIMYLFLFQSLISDVVTTSRRNHPAVDPVARWGCSWLVCLLVSLAIQSPKKAPRIRRVTSRSSSVMLRAAPSFTGRLSWAELARLICRTSRLLCLIYGEKSGTAGTRCGCFEVKVSIRYVHRQWNPELVGRVV